MCVEVSPVIALAIDRERETANRFFVTTVCVKCNNHVRRDLVRVWLQYGYSNARRVAYVIGRVAYVTGRVAYVIGRVANVIGRVAYVCNSPYNQNESHTYAITNFKFNQSTGRSPILLV
jgi:hypothetical protein